MRIISVILNLTKTFNSISNSVTEQPNKHEQGPVNIKNKGACIGSVDSLAAAANARPHFATECNAIYKAYFLLTVMNQSTQAISMTTWTQPQLQLGRRFGRFGSR